MPLTVSVASYNALLAVYAVSKVLDERGDDLLAEMKENNLLWDSYTYTALMMGRGERQEVCGVVSVVFFTCLTCLTYLSCLSIIVIFSHF